MAKSPSKHHELHQRQVKFFRKNQKDSTERIFFLAESTRERMLNLISKAYSSIRLTDMINHLGLSEQETLAKIQALGWDLDEESKFVSPKPIPDQNDDSSPGTFEDLMIKLTELVAFLEN